MNSTSDESTAAFVELSTGTRGDLPGWLCVDNSRSTHGGIVLVHGLGEHSGRYRDIAGVLAAAGFAVLGYDQQGHGRAPGRRGTPRSYDSMLDDIDAARQTLSQTLSQTVRQTVATKVVQEGDRSVEEPHRELPQMLFGHSMGGNLALNYTLRWPHNLAGLILSSPMLLPTEPPTRKQIFAVWLVGRLLPFIPIRAPIEPTELTHDAEEAEALASDPLRHARLSLHLATQMLAQGRWCLDHAAEVKLPLLVFHGEADTLADPAASQALCLRVGEQATFRELPGMYHETLHEVDREDVYGIIREWLAAH